MARISTLQKSGFNDPRREATIAALKRVIDPLVELMFDGGVTVHEFSQLVRERAVRRASARVSREIGRDSKSRIAIITGLPRSEVARMLRSDDAPSRRRSGQQPARKVLAAWFDNPRFLSEDGEPGVLPIFGKRRSFEQLVAMHSGGIPVRAMLDELIQIDAVEILSDQRIKAKSRVPVTTGLTGGAIEALGDRVRDLLDTLTYNLRRRSKPLFEGTALLDDTEHELVSLLRREISEQGANFINSANALLSRPHAKQNQPSATTGAKCRLGVTVYYFQDQIEGPPDSGPEAIRGRRKNLQRQRRPAARNRPNSRLILSRDKSRP